MRYIFITLYFITIISCNKPTSSLTTEKYLKEYETTPSEFIIKKFKTNTVVLLGEDHGIKNNLDFVSQLIPKLYKAGVYNLGMEFGASEMQHKVDSLLSAPQFDEELMRNIMFFYNVGWPYKEYMDVYKNAWKFNTTLKANDKKFRIINLSYQYNWSNYLGENTPEEKAEIFNKGEADLYRAKVVEKEVFDKNEKALLLVGTPHAFTKFLNRNLENKISENCPAEAIYLGHRLLDKHPDKVYTILLHQAFYGTEKSNYKLMSPAHGNIEKAMALNGNKPIAFDLVHSPMGLLEDNSFYASCNDTFRLNQFFDAYIFLVPFDQMDGCTYDAHFYDNHNWEDIRVQIPDPNWNPRPSTQQKYQEQRRAFVDIKERYKDVIN
ncbi:hypothetical protein [Flammeovirga kamogawensis]|uniref:ChaN family lipoprotein n=1 Tax=Flammeovirga kamogawensis TaxID=373891 RepID=A0ABX8H1G1_9BACT|nr:hypothetical protein [Flammeovirga kamogawensis]MBB6462350.1 hypothetical protein [Flammeovirga kamogawensis]QWG09464.1 hypothetical protein KM029_22930 [Flammeovirga kamogawensis]TRX64980.1 hypothetical protein EO216_20830 [Flammeovirga kamogawensis]